VSGIAGRFGLVKPGHPPKFFPICLFLVGTFKIVIDIANKKVQFSGGLMDPLPYKFAMVMVILKAQYCLNILSEISEYWSLKISGNAGIKKFYYHL